VLAVGRTGAAAASAAVSAAAGDAAGGAGTLAAAAAAAAAAAEVAWVPGLPSPAPTMLAQHTLFWLCVTLFELHAHHSTRGVVWEPGGGSSSRSSSSSGSSSSSNSSTSTSTSRAAPTTFMPLLSLLMAYAREQGELGLVHHLRVAVQRSTFTAFGLDF